MLKHVGLVSRLDSTVWLTVVMSDHYFTMKLIMMCVPAYSHSMLSGKDVACVARGDVIGSEEIQSAGGIVNLPILMPSFTLLPAAFVICHDLPGMSTRR